MRQYKSKENICILLQIKLSVINRNMNSLFLFFEKNLFNQDILSVLRAIF